MVQTSGQWTNRKWILRHWKCGYAEDRPYFLERKTINYTSQIGYGNDERTDERNKIGTHEIFWPY